MNKQGEGSVTRIKNIDVDKSIERIFPIPELVANIKSNEEVLAKTIDNLIRKIESVLNTGHSGGEFADSGGDPVEVLPVHSPLAKDLLKIKQRQLQQIRKLELIVETIEL